MAARDCDKATATARNWGVDDSEGSATEELGLGDGEGSATARDWCTATELGLGDGEGR